MDKYDKRKEMKNESFNNNFKRIRYNAFDWNVFSNKTKETHRRRK